MKLRRLALGLAVLGLSVLGPATPANAYIPTCGTKSNYFDGFYTPSDFSHGTPEGVSAVVTIRTAQVCDTPDHTIGNFTSDWVMIAAGGAGQGWSQVGFKRSYAGALVDLFQAYDGSGNFNPPHLVTDYGSTAKTIGSTVHYWEQFGASCGCVYSNIGSYRWHQTTFNPYAVWSYPFSAQISAEASYRENDVPGTPGSPVIFTSTQLQSEATDAFFNVPCGDFVGNTPPTTRWNRSTPNCTTYYTYTQTP